jgi:hypothetical protein
MAFLGCLGSGECGVENYSEQAEYSVLNTCPFGYMGRWLLCLASEFFTLLRLFHPNSCPLCLNCAFEV